MHDWWLGLIASAFGKIAYIDEGLILYRQHGGNDVGAQIFNFSYLLKRFNFKSIQNAKKSVNQTIKQAQVLQQEKGCILSQSYNEINDAYSNINAYNKINRILILFKYKLFKKGIIRNVVLLYVI